MMPTQRYRTQPVLEHLDDRLVLNASGTGLIQPILTEFAHAYLSKRGESNYVASLDTNHNGFIGWNDAKPILAGLVSVTPHVQQQVIIRLAEGDQFPGHHPANSGGVTLKHEVTIVGRTTPNSIVITDTPTTPIGQGGDFSFRGTVIPVDSQGYFHYRKSLPDQLTQNQLLVLDPFGHQTIRAFPILRMQR